MKITFSSDATPDVGDIGCIYFSGTVDGKRVRHRIFEEALSDCFDGAEGEDQFTVFERNRVKIEERAREKLEEGDVNDTGGVDLSVDDFDCR
jgi:hypothetical protein